MKVAISTTGNNIEADVDPRFGRCSHFLIFDLDKETIEVIENDAQFEGHGAGLRAAQIIVNKKVQAIISGNVGPNAFAVLQKGNITMYSGSGKIINAIEKLRRKELPVLAEPRKAQGARGMGQGKGQGRK